MLSLHAGALAQPHSTLPSVSAVVQMLTKPSAQVIARVAKLRRTTDKDERKAIKRGLPAVTWSGQFRCKGEDGFLKHSGLYVYDFDHVEDVQTVIYQFCDSGLPCLRLVWVSPSGEGVKVLLQGPVAETQDEHRTLWRLGARRIIAATGLEPVQIDRADEVSRLCYLGDNRDPNSYYEPDVCLPFSVEDEPTDGGQEGDALTEDGVSADDIPSPPTPKVDSEKVWDMLETITAAHPHDTWVRLVFAAVACLGHDDDTEAALRDWCQRTGGSQYSAWTAADQKVWRDLWRSAGKAKEGRDKVGLGTLVKMATAAGWVDWRKSLRTETNKQGVTKVVGCVYNVALVLRHHPKLKGRLWEDVLSGVSWLSPDTRRGAWLPKGGAVEKDLAWHVVEALQRHEYLALCSVEGMLDAMMAVAKANPRNLRKEWLASLTWDGVPRMSRLWVDGFGAPDTPLNRKCAEAWLTGAAARICQPGIDFQVVPVLVGQQGVGKSKGIAALCPHRDWFVDSPIDMRGGKAAYEVVRRATIVELGEMASVRKADRDAVKQFVSERMVTYQRSYDRQATCVPASWVFIGTTNEEGYLSDPTGNRRFVTIKAAGRNGDADETEAWVLANRDQLWAEAYARVQAGVGSSVSLDRSVWKDAEAMNREAEVIDLLDDRVLNYTQGLVEDTFLVMTDLAACVGVTDIEDMARQRHLGALLRKHGWERRVTREGRATVRGWWHAGEGV